MDTWVPIEVYLNGDTGNPIKDYFSFIWTDRYNEPGDFELQLPYSTANAKKYQYDSVITCNLSRGAMLVESITVSVSFDGGRILIVKGRSIESLLARRVVPDTLVCDSDEYVENKFITALNEICRSCFGSMVNIMTEVNNFTPTESAAVNGRDLGLKKVNGNYIIVASDPLHHIEDSDVRIEATGKDLLTILEENCKLMGFGFRLRDGNQIEIYDGTDRSATIVYSETNQNLSSIEYTSDNTDYKNYAFVQGEEYGEHSDRIVINGVEYTEDELTNKEFVANAVYKNVSGQDLPMYQDPNPYSPQLKVLRAGSSVTLSMKADTWGRTAEGYWVDMYLNGVLVLEKEEKTYYSPVADYDPNPNGEEPVYYRAGIGLQKYDPSSEQFYTPTGVDKREVYIESQLDRGQNRNEKYTQRLRKEGLLELTLNHKDKIQISCEVMHDTTCMYQHQFDLGDVVGIQFKPIFVPGDDGVPVEIDLIKMRIKEYTISHSPEGLDLYPTLELYDESYWQTVNDSIKYIGDESMDGPNGGYNEVKVYFMFNDGHITSSEGFNIVYGQDEWKPVWPEGYDFDDPTNTDCADIIGVYKEMYAGDWIVAPDLEPTRDEYSNFEGWYNGNHKYVPRNPDDTEKKSDEKTADYIPKGFEGDIEYIAQFDLKSYVLTFNRGDHGKFGAPYANEESIEKIYKFGVTPTGPSVIPINDTEGKEWVFDGWDPALATVTGDASYTAKWKEKPIMYSITWDCGSWGKFTDDEHKNQKYYTERVEHGSSLTPPGVEAYNTQSSTGATWEPADPAWSPEIPSEALADGRYTAQWKKKDVDEIDQDPDEENPDPDYDGEKIVISDKDSKTDDKNRAEIPSLLLKHFKSYACKKGDKYNAINPPNQEDIVDRGGLPDPPVPPYQDGDHWVKESWYEWATSPRLISDGTDQYFENETTIDLGKWWLVARFINPPASRAKGIEYFDNDEHSIGNAYLNSTYNAVFMPTFTMSLYQKIENSNELGGCLGLWWWRFGNGAKVAEVAFSTVPIFLPYRNYAICTGHKSGAGLAFVPGSYYIYTNYVYKRIWSKPSWWVGIGGTEPQNGYTIYKRKRIGWYVGFLAQAYDDEGRRIDRLWSRTSSGDIVTLTNQYKAISNSSSGPWTPVSDTVKQKWYMQLSYKYGFYYDGNHGDGQKIDGINTIFRNNSFVMPLSSICYSGSSYTAQTNDMRDIYMDSGIQFAPIPDGRLNSSSDVPSNEIYFIQRTFTGTTAPTSSDVHGKWTSENVINDTSGETTRFSIYRNAWSTYGFDSSRDMAYLFGKKFQKYYHITGGDGTNYEFTTYQDLVVTSYDSSRPSYIAAKWSLDNVDGKACRRCTIGGNTERDDQIGWWIGTKTSGISADALIKMTGSKSLICNVLKPMENAYCQSYGDFAYFNALDTMISIFSEIGLDTKISFQWQVKENNASEWRNINKDELYRGPIFDMRISSITDNDIGILPDDTEEVKTEKKNNFFGNLFGKTSEIFSGVQNEPNSFFANVDSLFKPVTSFTNDIKDKIDALREDSSDAVISLVPDITQMPSLRVKYNEQNAGYKYRCVITYTTDNETESVYAPNADGVQIYNS